MVATGRCERDRREINATDNGCWITVTIYIIHPKTGVLYAIGYHGETGDITVKNKSEGTWNIIPLDAFMDFVTSYGR